MTAESEAYVRMEGLDKSYGDLHVLRSLDLEITGGSKVAIIGPSGSGKSTLLRLLMTLERPDGGAIYVGGKPLWHEERNGTLVPAGKKHLRDVRRDIGMVFQHFNLFPHMTALGNVSLAPRLQLGLSRAEAKERAEALLKQVGLEEKFNTYPAQLSGGQKQRVAIARALALEPKLMLFDEVTSALDPELVGEVLNVLRDLANRSDMTMLVVTHEMRFAEEVANRVLFFDEGRIVEDGPPKEIIRNPREDRTKRFLSAFLNGGRAEEGGG